MAFFQGSLEEGIGIAVQQAKLVVCFVTGESSHTPSALATDRLTRADGEAESRLWEDDFFADEEVCVLKTRPHSVALI